MICSNCGNKFQTPLYLFNGQTTCPSCKQELLAVNSLAITKENEELFTLSKIAFLRYLSPSSCQKNKAGEASLTQKQLLEKAYKDCQTSARLGNPKAIYQMGYFTEYFQLEDKNQIERIRQAYEYYASVCYSELTQVKSQEGLEPYSEQSFLELKLDAGKNLLRICYSYQDLLKSSLRYDYKKNKERLSAMYPGNNFDYVLDRNSYDKVSTVYNVLTSSRSKVKAPLFGVCTLTARQFKELIEKKNNANQSTVKKLIAKDPDFLRYTVSGKNKKSGYYNRLPSQDAVDGLIKELNEEDEVNLFFFNGYGKHPYLSGKQISAVKKELEQDDQALLTSLVSVVSEDVAVFFDDDVEQFKSGKSVGGTVERLIGCIRGEQ